MIKKIISILLIISFLAMPAMAANEPENLTADFGSTYAFLDWDDVAGATSYNVSQQLPTNVFTATPPVLDGVIDQVFIDEAHRAIQFSPNPIETNDYDTFYILRNETYVFMAADTVDNDLNATGDWTGVYIDYNQDGLTNAEDVYYRIEEDGDVIRQRWSGSAWSTWAGSDAVGIVGGAGTTNPVYELWVPIAETEGFTNGTVHDILIERSSQEEGFPRVYSYQPSEGIPTDTTNWIFLYNSDPCDACLHLATVTESEYNVTGLDPFDWYKFGVTSIVAGVESDKVPITGVTESARWCVDGYVYEEDTGEPVRNAAISARDSMVVGITTTNVSGYYQICNIINDTYTIEVKHIGFTPADKIVTIAGENETVNIFLATHGANRIPLSMFIFFTIVNIICIAVGLRKDDDGETGITHVLATFISVVLSYVLSKMAINGQLVESFEYTSVIQNAAISYLLQYIAIIMFIILMIRIVMYLQERYTEEYE